jgi:hypothetical protein
MRTTGSIRGLVGAVVVACTLATASAHAGTIADGRLDVRGVGRPPGRQSVSLRVHVDPPPVQRGTVDATLTIGPTVVPLRATFGKRGVLTARAGRLDLAAALPDFGTARLDVPAPIGAVAGFTASACVPKLRAHRLECSVEELSPTPTISPTPTVSPTPDTSLSPPDGVYDADVARTDFPYVIAPAVASIGTSSDGHRWVSFDLSIFDSLWLSGPTDGSLAALTGFSITGGDIYATASGATTFAHDASGWRLDGTASDHVFGPPRGWAFTLRRPDAGTPSDAAGTWLVTFDAGGWEPSVGEAPLALSVAPDGSATVAATTIVVEGWPSFEFDAGDCAVAPAGAVSCRLPSSTEDYGPLRLHGAFDVGTGSGTFYIGSPPFVSFQGSWTALKQ